MGILDRINTVIKSNVNDVLDKMTDPAKEIDLLIHDMQESEKKATQELVESVAAAKSSSKRCDKMQQDVDQWYERAQQAVRAGDDELAREALQEKGLAERRLHDGRVVLQEQQIHADQLKRSLKQLKLKIKEIKARSGTLKHKARASRSGSTGLASGALADFHRIEDRIEALETESDLTGQLDGKDAEVEAKFARLEQENPQVEDALAELKRKMDQGK